MSDEAPPITTFVVTDIEADGPSPLGFGADSTLPVTDIQA